MANKGYIISISTNALSDIGNALIDKYGVGVTIYYQTTAYLIFGCPAISNKVIRIYYVSGKFTFNYGDAWTSTTTITNARSLQGNADGICTQIQLVLGDTFFLLNALAGSYTCFVIIGKLTNNNYIAIGLTSFTNVNSYGLCFGKNTSNDTDIMIVTLDKDFTGVDGKLYRQNLIIKKLNGGVEINADGSLATIDGLFSISAVTGINSMLVTSNSIFTSTNLVMNSNIRMLTTCLYAEW